MLVDKFYNNNNNNNLDHDADAETHERFAEIDHFLPVSDDRQRSNRQVSFLQQFQQLTIFSQQITTVTQT